MATDAPRACTSPTSRSGRSAPVSGSATRTAIPGTGWPRPITPRAPGASRPTGFARPVPASSSRSTQSARGGRPSGGKVTASVASASPYTGNMASGRKPAGAACARNASTDSTDTISAPLKATRQRLRSSRAISAAGTESTSWSYAKLGSGQTVCPAAATAASQRSGCRTK